MSQRAVVAGVGMVPFTTPSKTAAAYDVMGAAAARAALADAGVEYGRVEQAYVGYVYGDSTCGQATLYCLGLSGIPIVNVNNNCSTGSSALFLAPPRPLRMCSPEFAARYGLSRDVVIAGQAMTTDFSSTFDPGDLIRLVGYDMARLAAIEVYEEAGVAPEDIGVVELHDCFTTNELLTYESLGLTPEGTSEKFIADGDNTYGGRVVTNPSGGLLSKGHPLGATAWVSAPSWSGSSAARRKVVRSTT